MSPERAENGTEPWYVGFSNCQIKILNELRKLYPVPPHFLPADSEIPSYDYIFMGYDEGANMHVRLMDCNLNEKFHSSILI